MGLSASLSWLAALPAKQCLSITHLRLPLDNVKIMRGGENGSHTRMAQEICPTGQWWEEGNITVKSRGCVLQRGDSAWLVKKSCHRHHHHHHHCLINTIIQLFCFMLPLLVLPLASVWLKVEKQRASWQWMCEGISTFPNSSLEVIPAATIFYSHISIFSHTGPGCSFLQIMSCKRNRDKVINSTCASWKQFITAEKMVKKKKCRSIGMSYRNSNCITGCIWTSELVQMNVGTCFTFIIVLIFLPVSSFLS